MILGVLLGFANNKKHDTPWEGVMYTEHEAFFFFFWGGGG